MTGSGGWASETRVGPAVGFSGHGLEPVLHLLTSFFPNLLPVDDTLSERPRALQSRSGGGPGSRATRTELPLTKRRLEYFHGWQKVCWG